LAKVLSLSLRLFGNMYAGEVLAAVLLGAFAFAVPTVWLAMNVLVGVLQAMVFGALSAAYYTQAVKQMEEVTGEALPV
ncbi:MAG: F0F1 ATP synthase subunit A, partial [Candidatus Magasanikbacteria bacterium]|nr:F0F1 ATP synthase subunit A [Candidatus Magasanikbacteria bacterium]